MSYYSGAFKKYAVFSGRAGRREFWSFHLVNAIIFALMFPLSVMLHKYIKPDEPGFYLVLFSILCGVYLLVILVPSFAALVRRLHDSGKSGAWLFIVFVPVAGEICLIILLVMEGTSGDNAYGPDPKTETIEAARSEPVEAEESHSRIHGRTAMLTKMAMMVAISVIIAFIHAPILPAIPYIEYEPSNIPILISGFAFGPIGGLIIAMLTILLHDMMMGPSSGGWGMLMHFLATGAFVLVAGFIYRKHKSWKRAVVALAAGIVSVIAIMIPANIIITPIYTGMPTEAIIGMLVPFIIPFNLLSGTITSVVTFMIYKRISPFLHKR